MKAFKIVVILFLITCLGLSAAGLGVAVQNTQRNASEVMPYITVGNVKIVSAKFFNTSNLNEYTISGNPLEKLINAFENATYVRKLSSSDNYKNGLNSDLTLIKTDGTEQIIKICGYNVYVGKKKYSTNINFSKLLTEITTVSE